jgi:hypothetical protein
MHNLLRVIITGFFGYIFSIPASYGAPVPGPADFAYLFTINDLYEGTTPVNTGVVSSTSPFVNKQESYAATGGIATMDLSSTATATSFGAPLVQADLLGTSISVGNAIGQASAALSYQIVISGPGTPGDLVGVNFSALGSLTNNSPCTICIESWLSSSARLVVSDSGNDYFLLGDFLESNGDGTIFQSGIGTKPITVNTDLMLPIETPINVAMGVTAYGTTLGMFGNPGLQAPDNISVDAMLDPLFTPSDSNYTVLISSNLQPVPVPAAVWLFGSGLIGLIGVARRKK